MILGRDKCLLDERWDKKGAYHPILTPRILGDLRRAAVTVANHSGSVHAVILGARNNGVRVRDIVANGKNGRICSCRKCLLGVGS